MNFRKEVFRYLTAVRDLSPLGRTQLVVLMLAMTVTAILVASDSAFPTLMRVQWPAYLVLTIGGATFTIANEDPFAFAALVGTLIQYAVFLILTVVSIDGHSTSKPATTNGHDDGNKGARPPHHHDDDNDTAHEAAHWAAVGILLCGLLGYAGLQIGARGTWGWHAFRAQLTSPELVSIYRRVQLLHTALLLAFGNAVLAFLCVICLPREETTWIRVSLTGLAAIYAAVSGPVVAFCVHRDDKCGALTAGALSFVAFASATASGFLTIHHDRGNVHRIGAGQIWVSAVCHLAVTVALVATLPIYGTEVMQRIARARSHETTMLIDANEVDRRTSAGDTTRLIGSGAVIRARDYKRVDIVRDGKLNVPTEDGPWATDDEDER